MSDVKAAVRTIKLFEAFAQRKSPMNLSELAEQIEMPLSSCSLLIRTLLTRGYLYETGNYGTYYPTRRLLESAMEIARHDQLIERIQPFLERLRNEIHETVSLTKLQGSKMIYLATAESLQVIRSSIPLGLVRPLHSTAAGKALLSLVSDKERKKIFDEVGMPKLTGATILSRSQLETEIEASQVRGWFANHSESVPDLSAVAVPLTITAAEHALSVTGPSSRMEPNIPRYGKKLLELRKQIEAAFMNAGGSQGASSQPIRQRRRGRPRLHVV